MNTCPDAGWITLLNGAHLVRLDLTGASMAQTAAFCKRQDKLPQLKSLHLCFTYFIGRKPLSEDSIQIKWAKLLDLIAPRTNGKLQQLVLSFASDISSAQEPLLAAIRRIVALHINTAFESLANDILLRHINERKDPTLSTLLCRGFASSNWAFRPPGNVRVDNTFL